MQTFFLSFGDQLHARCSISVHADKSSTPGLVPNSHFCVHPALDAFSYHHFWQLEKQNKKSLLWGNRFNNSALLPDEWWANRRWSGVSSNPLWVRLHIEFYVDRMTNARSSMSECSRCSWHAICWINQIKCEIDYSIFMWYHVVDASGGVFVFRSDGPKAIRFSFSGSTTMTASVASTTSASDVKLKIFRHSASLIFVSSFATCFSAWLWCPQLHIAINAPWPFYWHSIITCTTACFFQSHRWILGRTGRAAYMWIAVFYRRLET